MFWHHPKFSSAEELNNFNVNKTGLQPVSKPVGKEVGLFKDVKRGLTS